jgi:hypothetical protein
LPVKGVAVKTSTISYPRLATGASLATSRTFPVALYPDVP